MRYTALIVVLGLSSSAFADGGVFGKMADSDSNHTSWLAASEDRQRAVIYWRDGIETLLLDVGYRGGSGDLAWLVPVPAPPVEDGMFAVSHWYIAQLFTQADGHRERELLPPKYSPFDHHPLAMLEPLAGNSWIREWWRERCYSTEHQGVAPDAAMAAEPAEGEVAVLERRQVDAFDVAVLSATNGAELDRWLRREGYLPAEHTAKLAAQYIARGWRFVAMRIQDPAPDPGQRLLRLNAIALRFRSEAPVFPLEISRLSSPPRMVVDLLTLTPQPVTCASLPVIPPEALVGQGETIDQARLRLCQAAGYRALVQVHRGVPFGGVKRSDARGQPPIEEHELSVKRKLTFDDLTVSRFWSLLDREAMVDLHFGPQPGAPAAVLHERCEMRYRPRRDWLWRASWLPLLLMWLVTALAVHWTTDRDRCPAPAHAGRRFVVVLRGAAWAVLASWMAVQVVQGGLLLSVGLVDVDYHVRRACYVVLLLLAVAAGGVALQPATGERPGAARVARFLAWCGLAAGLAVGVPLLWRVVGSHSGLMNLRPSVEWLDELTMLSDEQVVPVLLALIAWPLTFVVIGLLTRRRSGCVGVPWAMSLLHGSAAALTLGILMLHLAYDRHRDHPEHAAQTVTAGLQYAIDRFVEDQGCYPVTLDALLKPATVGLDSSGNSVPVAGVWDGPYLSAGWLERTGGALPIDPTTGRRDTWRYDPTADRIIDAGGWDTIEVTMTDQ